MIRFNAKQLAAVAVAQSTEETRYYLRGVYLSGDKAVATDGTLMTVATDETFENAGDHIMPVSKKAITALKHRNADLATFENGTLTVFDDRGEVLYLEACQEIDATFPDWTRVIPEVETADAKTGRWVSFGAFSCELLARIAQTGKILGNGSAMPASFKGDDEQSAHVVTYHNAPAVFSVVMPMRT